MIIVAVVALAGLSVVLCGGSLVHLSRLRIRAKALIAAALAIQILVISVIPTVARGWTGAALHIVSYCLAVLFLVANRRIPWLWFVGVGGLANFVAIGANGGVMPASTSALKAAGRYKPTGEFLNSRSVSGAHLSFLGDVFATPRNWPLHNVFSIGDVFLVVGATLLLHSVCESGAARAARRVLRTAPARKVLAREG